MSVFDDSPMLKALRKKAGNSEAPRARRLSLKESQEKTKDWNRTKGRMTKKKVNDFLGDNSSSVRYSK